MEPKAKLMDCLDKLKYCWSNEVAQASPVFQGRSKASFAEEETSKTMLVLMIQIEHIAKQLGYTCEAPNVLPSELDVHIVDNFLNKNEDLFGAIREELDETERQTALADLKTAALKELEDTPLLAEEADFIRLEPPQRTKIQASLDKLRDMISEADDLEEDHRYRLLRRTTQLQDELNKEVSTFFRTLGQMVFLADSIGKAGDKLKPAVDRAREITEMFSFFKSDNAQISADAKPKQIEDKSDTEE